MRSQISCMKDVKLNLISKRQMDANLRAKRINRINALRIEKCDTDEDGHVETEYDSDESTIKLEDLENKAKSDPNLQPVVVLKKLQQQVISSTSKCDPKPLLHTVDDKKKDETNLKPDSVTKTRKCSECCKTFKSQNYLQRHLKSHKEKHNLLPNEHKSVEDNLEKTPKPDATLEDQAVGAKVPIEERNIKFKVIKERANKIEIEQPEGENEELQVNEKLAKEKKILRKDKISTRGKIHKSVNSRKSLAKSSVMDTHSKTHTIEKQFKFKTTVSEDVSNETADVRKQSSNNSKSRLTYNRSKAVLSQCKSVKEHQRTPCGQDNCNDKRSESFVSKVARNSRSVRHKRKIVDKENDFAINASDTLHLDSTPGIDKRGNTPKLNIKADSEGILIPTIVSKHKSCKRVSKRIINSTEKIRTSNSNEKVFTVKNKRRKVTENDNKEPRKAAGKVRIKHKTDDAETKNIKISKTKEDGLSCEKSLYSPSVVVLENIGSKIAKSNLTTCSTESKIKSDTKLEPAVKRHTMSTRSAIKTKQ